MQLSDPGAYYADREVPHTAQGDIYAGIPSVHATLLTPAFEAAGARKRPDSHEYRLMAPIVSLRTLKRHRAMPESSARIELQVPPVTKLAEPSGHDTV